MRSACAPLTSSDPSRASIFMSTRGREMERPIPPKRRSPEPERSRKPRCSLARAAISTCTARLADPGGEEVEGLPLLRTAGLVDQGPEPRELLQNLLEAEQVQARGGDRRLDDRVPAAVEAQEITLPSFPDDPRKEAAALLREIDRL